VDGETRAFDFPLPPAPEDEVVRGRLWSLIDWSLWGAGMADVFREPVADVMVMSVPVEVREHAELIMEDFLHRREITKTGVDVYKELRDRAEKAEAELAEAELAETKQVLAEEIAAFAQERDETRRVDVLELIRERDALLADAAARKQRALAIDVNSAEAVAAQFDEYEAHLAVAQAAIERVRRMAQVWVDMRPDYPTASDAGHGIAYAGQQILAALDTPC
jgi:hypothetical protein